MKKMFLIVSLLTAVSGFMFPQDSERTYNVGDIGPTGGIVFYDKGAFSNGWRYLEAAPVELEFTSQWGGMWDDISGTGTEIGSGRRNTQYIIEHLNRREEIGRAAQLCVNLDYNGFTDWFLPSQDELDLMYKNLKQKRLGSFSNNWYLSSSQRNYGDGWGQSFRSGSKGGINKMETRSVRAIRAF